MGFSAAAAAKSLQLCLTLCDPIDGSPPGSPRPWDSPGKSPGVGCHFFLMEFSRQEYLSGLPCPPPGDLPNPGIKPASLRVPALAGGIFTTSATWEA